jgi:hypothetical protein
MNIDIGLLVLLFGVDGRAWADIQHAAVTYQPVVFSCEPAPRLVAEQSRPKIARLLEQTPYRVE